MTDRFSGSDTDFDQFESFDDDGELEGILDGLEDIDDEFLGQLISGGLSTAGNLLGSLSGAATGAARGLRRPTPNVQRMPTALPRPRPGLPSPTNSRIPATVAQIQSIARQTEANRSAITTVNKRAEVINNRVNTVEKKLSSEVARLSAVNVTQNQTIQRQQKQIGTLRGDLAQTTQTSLLMTLLSGGEKEYQISKASDGVEVGKNVTLKPAGDKLDSLLPILLMSGSGGASGSKGGMFDNPLLLLLLMGGL